MLSIGFYTLAVIAVAILLDKVLGEPSKYHPLVGFGLWANFLQKTLNIFHNQNEDSFKDSSFVKCTIYKGIVAWCLAILPFLVLVSVLSVNFITDALLLYLVIGWRSLQQHIEAIEIGLNESLEQGRYALSMIVSRNTDQLQSDEVAQAGLESLLENSNDALFASLFWYLVGELIASVGIELAVLHRLANTLDAMWGYKTEQFLFFGRWAAKVDDVMGYVPARLTAILFLIESRLFRSTQVMKQAIRCWQQQAAECDSPNGGVVMTAGAGALQVTLSQYAYYHNEKKAKPVMGIGKAACSRDLARGIQLINRGLVIFLFILLVFSISYSSLLLYSAS